MPTVNSVLGIGQLDTAEEQVPSTLQGAEILFGFVGWLTSRKQDVTMSGGDDASEPVRLIGRFLEANNLSDDCRQGWDRTLNHPAALAGELEHEDDIDQAGEQSPDEAMRCL